MNAKYQHDNFSLVQIDCLPPSAEASKPEPLLVLSNDVEGKAYTLSCISSNATESEMPTLYSVGLTRYVEVKTPTVLEYDGNSIQVEPGIYRARKESDYVYKQHGRDVAEYAVLVGAALGFDEGHLKELEFAGLMHDIGLSGLEDTLWKAQWFTDEDWAIVKGHPARGAQVVEKLIGHVTYATDRSREYVLHHHAHYDGSGYPDSLAAEQIPIGARILLIADAYHAMTSWRPFRQPLPEHVAMDRLFADAGFRYDKELLEVFAHALDEQAITALVS